MKHLITYNKKTQKVCKSSYRIFRWLIILCMCIYSFNMLHANDIITLDLNNPTNPPVLEPDEEKGHWVETYNNAEEFRWMDFGLFSFTHILNGFGGTNVGDGMSYWDGFTYCTSGDTTDYGVYGDSDGWLSEQWGCMAGGGIKTDEAGNIITDAEGKVSVEKGIPYLVVYWGYWVEMNQGGGPCLQVKFIDEEPYEAVGVYICNHPWPYYGNIHGDGFAEPFTEEGQYFKLRVHGMNQDGEDIGIVVDHMLAEFKDGELYQSPDWQWVDLSSLGTVYGLYFTMESTDIHNIIELGPNTAVYFCMDKLQVRPAQLSNAPSRPSGLNATVTETTIDLSWTASTGRVEVKGYNLYLDGEFKAFTQEMRYIFTGLSAYTEYQPGVEAVAVDESLSERGYINVRTTDETPPTTPANLTGTTEEYTMILSWDASTDNVGVTEYHIYLDGQREQRVYATNTKLIGLDAGTTYFVEVEARDASGNRSERAGIWLTTKEIGSGTTYVEETGITVYPNPIVDKFYIETPTYGTADIYNLQGIKFISTQVSAGLNYIDISYLPAGIYLVRCNQITKTIIK